jgi:hypothetical protein
VGEKAGTFAGCPELGRSQEDLQKGLGKVDLPHALERKYPEASAEFAWQYVFPSAMTFARFRNCSAMPI